ncbi:MAG: A/G-specific adenine glycosylase [Propionibacteriaceae bacterium]|nr:A/G-specific adenine glycosylase [Propionibacteriaceae bacterium]
MPADKPAAAPGPAERARVVGTVAQWFTTAARPLPWRDPSVGPWGVMVSEFMTQQTPVARVIEPWRAWLRRWPEPASLAAEPSSEAVAAWGRLGYPRRALRLHGAAVAIVARHGGRVPAEPEQLRALPGVGEYTAAAIASFAFGARAVVLDTNVRRVLARIDRGRQYPANSTTAAERRLAARWLPADAATAARWAASSMELGALVCTAAAPDCVHCPVAGHCRWLAAGRPAHEGPARRGQAYAGTDRQARGRLLDQLRRNRAGVETETLLGCWDVDRAQARRALDGLLADGLAHRHGELITL